MTRHPILLLTFVLLFSFRHGTAFAQVVYDQQHTGLIGTFNLPDAGPVGQEFVPSLNGLDFFDFSLSGGNLSESAQYRVNIRQQGIFGSVLASSLSSNFGGPAGTGEFLRFDFSTRVGLIPGQVYVAEIVFLNGNNVYGINYASGYLPGRAILNGSPIDTDLRFRHGIKGTNPPPLIIREPSSAQITVNESITFTILVSSAPPTNYRWTKDGDLLASATGQSLTISNATVADAGTYRVQITNSAGGVESRPFTLQVIAPPLFIEHPLTTTVEAGSSLFLDAAASGTSLFYQWYKNGKLIINGIGREFFIPRTSVPDSGTYWVVASNIAGVAESLPAVVTVGSRAPLIFTNGVFFGGEGDLQLTSLDSLEFRSLVPNARIFYTLDGSPPSYHSDEATGPLRLRGQGTLAAIAYSADYSEFYLGQGVHYGVINMHNLSTQTGGGGRLAVTAEGPYPEGSSVTVIGIPDEGWHFLGWLGDANLSNSNAVLQMNGGKRIKGVFAAAISGMAHQGGTVDLYPRLPSYPYKSLINVHALPAQEHYFIRWGGDLNGTAPSALFTHTNADPQFVPLFGQLPLGEVSFTRLSRGGGEVKSFPSSNKALPGNTFLLEAVPDQGWRFAGWSDGMLLPYRNFELLSNTVLQAAFEKQTYLTISPASPHRPGKLAAEPALGAVFDLEKSNDLSIWQKISTLTNFLGITEVTIDQNPQKQFFRIRISNPR